MWIKAYSLFERGMLPSMGGWLSQSNKFLEIMNFIDINLKESRKQNDGRK